VPSFICSKHQSQAPGFIGHNGRAPSGHRAPPYRPAAGGGRSSGKQFLPGGRSAPGTPMDDLTARLLALFRSYDAHPGIMAPKRPKRPRDPNQPGKPVVGASQT
jgi:hypothetical protein